MASTCEATSSGLRGSHVARSQLSRDYLIFDRGLLGYLNAVERLNCIHCSYANGVIGYVREVAARTEQYWCPIMHATRPRDTHPREAEFLAYGDAKAYNRDLPKIRAKLSD